MPVKKLKDFLDLNKIKYVSVFHSTAYTSQEIAASAHIRGKELAKTVMLRVDGTIVMAVLPANFKVDFDLLKEAVGARKIELAGEQEFQRLFPGCDVGAMPPFGNLYGVEEVLVDRHLTEDKEIAFNAGTHNELIKLAYEDFEALVKPKVIKFAAKIKSDLPDPLDDK
jgi:Ala-tRNA(Pro) deacylase